MATPTADQLIIEKWTGDYNAVAHDDLYDQYGDGHLVALHVLRQRLSQALCGPAEAGVDGDYQEDWGATITALERQIADLENQAEALGLDVTLGNRPTLTVGRIYLDEVRNR